MYWFTVIARLSDRKNGVDFCYIHMEAPDECGHHGDTKNKIYSIEQIDKVVQTIYNGLTDAGEDFAFLILPDHPTPLSIMTHCADPVPYLLYSSKNQIEGAPCYDEEQAEKSSTFEKVGHNLIKKLFAI